MKYTNVLLILFIFGYMISCELYPQDDYEEYYVVESYLVAEQQLPELRLFTTAPVEKIPSNVNIDNAEVEVYLLDKDDENIIEEFFSYKLTKSGTYVAIDSHKVLPKRTYGLFVTFANSSDKIKAKTTVPGTFQVKSIPDTVVYRSGEHPEISISESYYPGRQNIFVFITMGLQYGLDNITPHYREMYEKREENQKDDYLLRLRKNSSGIVTEENFRQASGNRLSIDYEWSQFGFFGDNLVVINALDDNIYDFVRSQTVQLGGSSLSPGEIQNVIYNIDGAIGVFGALATDTAAIYLKRN